ncbi:cytochrome c oxidase subunit 7A1, mitochondrial [Drosophila busckii]|uniref:cytochrome c oxidase subunit 7A1, mitochondrial n=1 Tax=Drosophila busckii TaxID=30019 RepID=UPI00083EE0AB|nr:cytochrome c oxidase subunit 7A1, mitochondrial [Drosophila busckii]
MQRNIIFKFLPLLNRAIVVEKAPMIMKSKLFHTSSIVRMSCGSSPGKLTPKMAKLQKLFQEENDKPVFLKGGTMDNILYISTLVLCLLGLIGDVLLFVGYIIA